MRETECFELKGNEFIELNKLLKFLGWVETGGEAKIRIDNGEVEVNGKTEYRKRCKLRAGDRVKYNDKEIWVE